MQQATIIWGPNVLVGNPNRKGGSDSMVPNCKVQVAACLPKS